MFQIDMCHLDLAVAGLVSYRASWWWHHRTFQAAGHIVASLFSVLPLDGVETQKRTDHNWSSSVNVMDRQFDFVYMSDLNSDEI